MDIRGLLAKAIEKNDGTFSEDEVKFIQNFDFDKEMDSRARKAKEGFEAQKAKIEADNKAAIEALNKEISDLKTKAGNADQNLTEIERLSKQVETLTESIGKERETREAAEKAIREKDRTAAITSKFAGIKLIEGFNRTMAENDFASRFSDLSDEDLSNPELVKPIMESWSKDNAGIIASTDPGGGPGNPGNPSNPPSGSGEYTREKAYETLKSRGLIAAD